MKKALLFIMAAGLLTGCGGAKSYADGVYTGQSELYESLSDDDGDAGGDGYGVATVTIAGGRITACDFITYMPDGTVKGEDYGKWNGEIANQDYYNKAQRAVRASQNYAEQLAAKGELQAVDAISGATISYREFQDAVDAALRQAQQ